MTMYLPNPGLRPTGYEAGEFIETTSMSDHVEFGQRPPRTGPKSATDGQSPPPEPANPQPGGAS